MQNYTMLSGPALPQMIDDGYITDVELQSDGGAVVDVNWYPLAAHGDYLGLYWDGRLFGTLSLNDPDTYAWPWTVVIPESYAPDGPHQAWYTVTDVAQNQSASPISMAVVDRQHTDGLPPPLFTDADATNTITYTSVIQNNGTHVKVPWSMDAYAAGDTVYIYWRELDSVGNTIPGSSTNITHSVNSSDVGKGFKVLIEPPFVTAATPGGNAEVWYSVISTTESAKSSQTGIAKVDMSDAGYYPAPHIPAGNDGWIDCSELTAANGVEIDVLPSSQFVAGSGVVVYWQGYDATGSAISTTSYQTPSHSLTPTDVTAGFSVLIPASYVTPIGTGSAQAWYTVTSPSIPGVSGVTGVRVDAQHCSLLPPPVFPNAAGDNTLTGAEVTADNGTDMNIYYPGMAAGDTVAAFWVGYLSSPESPVTGATWTETRTLTAAEAQAQLAIFHVPADNITPVGNGFGEGRYQVMYSSGGVASSDVKDVNIAINGSSELLMGCGTGAPIFDPTVLVRPLNAVTLSGPAGASIELSLSSGSDAWFQPDGVQTLLLTLDEAGRGSAQVYSFSTGNVQVSAFDISDPALSATASMTFSPWTLGTGDLLSYGISTNATADGLSACGVYMQTTESSTALQAKLTLTGTTNAILPISGTTMALVNVSSSHAAGFDVTDSVVESVTFTLSLPDTGAYVTGKLVFSSLLSELPA
ncbi:hypothetical protein [Cronobacter turicensis]|uniref:hypothetical protein n=1 Tax=Cronobacter turicensis TaxID=413502 RepID=UPI0011AD1210|nr:hypothetical protein [Cronobacter turicensis]TWR32661.1 hypothetical protein FQY85_18355 [Cronobacter turicensis]